MEIVRLTDRQQQVAELSLLTKREREIARLVGGGLSYDQIARRLGIAPRTVRIHVSAVDRKIAAEGSTPYRRVMRWALEHAA